MTDVPDHDKVWIKYKDRWYPGILETWNRRNGSLRMWITYAVPVNGWPGGWYDSVLSDEGDDPNDEDRGWTVRVAAARSDR